MATRRSSTSAIERIRKHDRRTFETPLPNSGHSAFAELPISQAGPTRGMGRRVNGVVPPRGSRGFTGQGPLVRARSLARRPLRLPPATIARDESFAPTRSTLGHLLSRHPIAPRLESPQHVPNGPANQRRFRRFAPARPLSWTRRTNTRFHAHSMRAASRTSSRKEDAFRCTRGAFLRKTPFREVPFSTACHQPVEWSPRLFNLHA
jgi:hypothetical protein